MALHGNSRVSVTQCGLSIVLITHLWYRFQINSSVSIMSSESKPPIYTGTPPLTNGTEALGSKVMTISGPLVELFSRLETDSLTKTPRNR